MRTMNQNRNNASLLYLKLSDVSKQIINDKRLANNITINNNIIKDIRIYYETEAFIYYTILSKSKNV